MRAQCRQEDCHRHQGGGYSSIFKIPGCIQNAAGTGWIIREDNGEYEYPHQYSPHDAEKEPVSNKLGALVIILGELCEQGCGRYFIDADDDAGRAGHQQEICKQGPIRGAGRGLPQQEVEYSHWYHGRIHEWVATSPFAPQAIGPLTNNRIKGRVGSHRKHDRCPDPSGRKTDDLIVVDHQKGVEAVVLDAEGDGPEPVDDLCRPRELGCLFHCGLRHATGVQKRI